MNMIDFQNGMVFKLSKDRKTKETSVSQLLVPGEEVIDSYSSVRDYVVFTTKRIITVNIQGVGAKRDYTSIPYSRIQVFSVETAGVFDLEAELEIYISSIGKLTFEFSRGSKIQEIGQVIAQYVLK